MKKKLTAAAFLLALTLPLAAQDWSVGAGSGAFVFGDFYERKVRLVTEGSGTPAVTQTLSAGTRPGLLVDIERSFGERWAVRLEGAFTRAPLALKVEGGEEPTFELDAGDLDVTTFMLPIVFRVNPRGALRFHLLAGPAYAIYRPVGRSNVDASVTVFRGTKSKWGGAAGIGAAWFLSGRFAIEGQITDIVTASPFERSDFGDVPGIEIPKPHNVHTTVGVRYRF